MCKGPRAVITVCFVLEVIGRSFGRMMVMSLVIGRSYTIPLFVRCRRCRVPWLSSVGGELLSYFVDVLRMHLETPALAADLATACEP
jgi:hypothetical protein